MSPNKHTSGPWSAHEKGDHPNPYVCGAEREYEHGPDKPVVAYIVGTDTQANARLIAAAPDLLEALKALRDACMGRVPDCAGQVDAAIAKAEGPALPLHEGSGS